MMNITHIIDMDQKTLNDFNKKKREKKLKRYRLQAPIMLGVSALNIKEARELLIEQFEYYLKYNGIVKMTEEDPINKKLWM